MKRAPWRLLKKAPLSSKAKSNPNEQRVDESAEAPGFWTLEENWADREESPIDGLAEKSYELTVAVLGE